MFQEKVNKRITYLILRELMNKLTVEVASLKKKLENLVKGKAKALNKKLDNILKNKKSKIKAFEAEIKTLRKKVEKLEVEQLKNQSSE
jgi:seryl-tRNA synthetase